MIFLFSLVSVLFSSFLTGCAGKTAAGNDPEMAMAPIAMAPLEQMPAEVQSAAASVRQAYQFAAANPDTLKQFPCYCGCGKMGHTSNYSCYIQGSDSSGKLSYDPHALGCSICVDITQDVMRLLKEKKPIQEIRTYIDSTYSRYGPSNMGGIE